MSLSFLWIVYITRVAGGEVRTCGFRRTSSTLDKAPKLRDSVRLKFLESLSVTFPSISSETWAMYSSAITGSSMFFDSLFLVYFGACLKTAVTFPLFLNVAMILREKLCQLWKLNWFFVFVTKMSICSIVREKEFQQKQTVNDVKLSTITKGYQFI